MKVRLPFHNNCSRNFTRWLPVLISEQRFHITRFAVVFSQVKKVQLKTRLIKGIPSKPAKTIITKSRPFTIWQNWDVDIGIALPLLHDQCAGFGNIMFPGPRIPIPGGVIHLDTAMNPFHPCYCDTNTIVITHHKAVLRILLIDRYTVTGVPSVSP